MPLPKKIAPDDDGEVRHHAFDPFSSVAEMSRAAFDFASGLMGFRAVKVSDKPELPLVGKYYADYSEVKPEEIADLDAECAELFKRSKPVSR